MIVKYKHIVVKDGDMYRVLYPDRVLSKDHYNETWAKHHARELTEEASRIARRMPAKRTEKATGALFSEIGT